MSSLPIQQPFPSSLPPMASTFARTLRAFAEKEQISLESLPQKPVKLEIAKKKALLPVGSPLTPGAATAKEKAVPPPVTEQLAEKKTEKKPNPQPLLLRVWNWLQKSNKFSATKQLRVAETISLGEKRFVSLIQVDGQKFLIGGGATGVSLLTPLGAAEGSTDMLQAIAGAAERLK